jgi:hypothetical protein
MFAAAFPLFGDQSKTSCRSMKFVEADLVVVYKKLGFQWASSLLAFLTLAMLPFP